MQDERPMPKPTEDEIRYSVVEAMSAGLAVVGRQMFKSATIAITVMVVIGILTSLTYVRPAWLAWTGLSIAALLITAVLMMLGVDELERYRARIRRRLQQCDFYAGGDQDGEG